MNEENKYIKVLDELLEWYNANLPPVVPLLKVKDVYDRIFASIEVIEAHLRVESPDVVVSFEHGGIDPRTLNVFFEAEEFVFQNSPALIDAFKIAKNIEFYPKLNGKIVMGVVYAGAYKLYPPNLER